MAGTVSGGTSAAVWHKAAARASILATDLIKGGGVQKRPLPTSHHA
jgi:hypothetical protein